VEYKLETDKLHGQNKALADAVNNIGEGIRKAVKTSMKDEQLKTDLITNVSHDIKTPLTSIINYVDLLKRLKIEEEPAKGYITILDTKAQRLKQLTDDLVEASKISSGNIELNLEKLNLTELLNQSIGEFSEKLEEKQLQVVFENKSHPAFVCADSRRMWRVVENLFNNICKYAMEGTRVYIDLESENERVCVSVKNISKQQMNIHPDELTERFIRGDLARSTEGSGLGLSIAKSLVLAQGGTFEIKMDGDLFKIVISFAEYICPELQEEENESLELYESYESYEENEE
jgi:signal transduction histidine kinase